MKIAVILIALLSIPALAFSDTINIPADYPTIQEGIDAAVNGDTVLVAPGTYEGPFDFLGKAITLTSSAGPELTQLELWGPVVDFHSGEGPDSILDGFTVTKGLFGTAIRCMGASPTIRNNIIRDNLMGQVNRGGGIYCIDGASPCIECNIITGNEVYSEYMAQFAEGGGIYVGQNCAPVIMNNLIEGNRVLNGYGGFCCGGGIYCEQGSDAYIAGNLIRGNKADSDGGGIYCKGKATIVNNMIVENDDEGVYCAYGSSDTVLINNTIVNNDWKQVVCHQQDISIANSILLHESLTSDPIQVDAGTVTVSHSNVENGWPGTGNIDTDPIFVESSKSDYHLTYLSPCLDAGDNAAVSGSYDFEGDPRIAWCGNVDMGADEFYTHLYATGEKTPGGAIKGKLIGLPGTTPVGLFIGSGVRQTPVPTPYGAFWLLPPMILVPLIPIPANGVLAVATTVPGTPPAPYDVPMQGLVGLNPDSLTNLYVLEVR